MITCLNFAVIPLLAASVLASPLHVRHVQHERREFTPRGWAKGERLHGDAVLPMRIGLKQSNLDKGHAMLMDVYDFSS